VWPIGVGEPQRDGPEAVGAMVEQAAGLRGSDVDPVHVHCCSVTGRKSGSPYCWRRARIHHPRRGVAATTGLQECELVAAVEFEIRLRISHRPHVAGPPGEVEDDVAAPQGGLVFFASRRSVRVICTRSAIARTLCSFAPPPGMGASRISTSASSSRRRAARWEPMKPSPPDQRACPVVGLGSCGRTASSTLQARTTYRWNFDS
jgi:hypothetical protein